MRARSLIGSLLLVAVGCGGSTSSGGSGGAAGAGGLTSGGNGGSGAVSSGGSGAVSSGGSGAGSGGTNVGGTGAGGSASWADCDAPGTCVLAATNCCGYCGPAPLSGYTAVNQTHAADLNAQLCADPQACPDCVTYEEPNYLALCRGGQCTPVDLRLDSLSACSTSADCRLRFGTSCCESCGGTENDLVAYNKNANLEAEVCAPNGGACPPCVPPPYPDTAAAFCNNGHCEVDLAGSAGK
jgi:hypothetical protein